MIFTVPVLAFAALLAVGPTRAAPSSSSCRCLSSDSCFPSTSVLSAFNSTVSGRLVSISPPAISCYPGPAHNATTCATITNGFDNPYVREQFPGATMHRNTQGDRRTGVDTCPVVFSAGATCGQGAVSTYGVLATTPADVQKTVQFASAHNLRLAVKNTGHSYNGQSTAPGSFLLDTHYMKGINFIDAFVPAGCKGPSAVGAVEIAAGEQWGSVYLAAAGHNLAVVGGAAETVGAVGGYLQGAGHGPLSRSYGLAADNALQFSVVTASGSAVIANACTNPTLYWALRGGGGSTFGVVTSAVLKTHPSPPTAVGLYTLSSANSTAVTLLREAFVDAQSRLDAAGVSGYFVLGANYIQAEAFQPNGTNVTLAQAFAPLVSKAHALDIAVTGESLGFPSFYQAFQTGSCVLDPTTCTQGVGDEVAIGSRLIPESLFATAGGRAQVSSALDEVLDLGSQYLLVLLVAGGQVSRTPVDSSAVNPAWRTAHWHLVTTNGWANNATAAEIALARKATTTQVNVLKKLAPASGAYLNEADGQDKDWQQTFWGAHYPKLRQLKHQWDPNGLFVCWQCVGSEAWSADGNCRRPPHY
ncbi:hypothetical protein HKX48_006864 [Thoreauomyces humboldtii]|nr:hypothetical protein HKX48_006864 [Thoreauomyces humboldtii]